MVIVRRGLQAVWPGLAQLGHHITGPTLRCLQIRQRVIHSRVEYIIPRLNWEQRRSLQAW